MHKKSIQLTEQQRHFVMSSIIFVAVGIVLAGGYLILQSSRNTRSGQADDLIEVSDASSQLTEVQSQRLALSDEQLAESGDSPKETASLLRSKATILENTGDIEGSISLLLESLGVEDPSSIVEVNVRFKLATLYSQLDSFDEALEQVDLLIDKNVLFDAESKAEAQARKEAYQKQQMYDDSRVCEGENGEDEPC